MADISTRKILHLCPDSVLMDWARNKFEETIPGIHTFVFPKSAKANNNSTPNCLYFSLNQFKSWDKKEDFDAIVIHRLDFFQCLCLREIKSHVPVAWCGWGWDYYYAHPKLRNKNLLTKTKIKRWQLHPGKAFADVIRHVLNVTSLDSLLPKSVDFLDVFWLQKSVLKKITHFAPIIPSEFEIVKKAYGLSNVKHLKFTYGDISKYKHLKPVQENEIRILMGNSATFPNNHFDLFKSLPEDLNVKIICPLSYNSPKLAAAVKKYGEKRWGKNFLAITDFLPIQEYYDTIGSCNFVVMNHTRQQGLGNINAILYRGGKVFLRKDNPLFDHFNNLGATVYSIESLGHEIKRGTHSAEIQKKNKLALSEYYNEEEIRRAYLNFVNTLIN